MVFQKRGQGQSRQFLGYLNGGSSTIAVYKKVLWFEISVYDASRVTEVDSVDELIHDEFDLLGCDSSLIG